MEKESGSKFDPNELISRVLSFESYIRLMCMLGVFGLLLGLSYFVYSRAVYRSKAMVKVSVFSSTADEKGNMKQVSLSTVRRQLMDQLRARHLQTRAAIRAGFVSEGVEYGEMRLLAFPSINVGVLDEDFLEITTLSFFPDGVRDFPEALISEYLEKQEVLRSQYREDAVKRYSKELVDIRERLDKKLLAKLDFEEQNKLAEVHIQQDKLSSVPVDLVLAKDRVKQMTEIQKVFLENGEKLDVLAKLALLNRFEELEPVKIGKMIRRSRDGTTPVKLAATEEYSVNASTNVVVQPAMVEGLRSWQELEKQQRMLEEKLEVQRKTFGVEHPVIKKLKADLVEVKDGLEAELEVEVKSFELEYAQIQEKVNELELKIPEYHKVTRAYDKQRLDYNLLDESELAWDKAHKEISERIAGLEFGKGRKLAEFEFAGFSELRDIDPVSPNKMKLLILGLVLGVGMAVGVPFVIDMFDDTAATLQQLETATGLTGIGVVPLTNKEDLEDIVRSPALGAKVPNFLLETFRVIRSNVVLHPNPSGMSQVVMVTSACPGEGKTTQAANLAWAFSSMGEKTLLVDCDLRRGRVHGLTQINNEVGMTALLPARVTDEEVIQSVGVEGLKVIPRGPVIAGTTEILCQARFEQLMEEWRKKYDRIVMDTPPVLGLSETIALQRLADGVIVVVRSESTTRKDVIRAVELLKKGGANFFGFVLNRVDLTRRANYYNYYYYSAHYYDDFIESSKES